MKKLCLSLLLVSCSSTITPAQHVRNLKAELDFVKLACGIYKIDPNYPRDSEVTKDCDKLLQ